VTPTTKATQIPTAGPTLLHTTAPTTLPTPMMAPGATLINTTEGNSQDVTVTVFLETDQNTKNEALMAQLEKCENEQPRVLHSRRAARLATKYQASREG